MRHRSIIHASCINRLWIIIFLALNSPRKICVKNTVGESLNSNQDEIAGGTLEDPQDSFLTFENRPCQNIQISNAFQIKFVCSIRRFWHGIIESTFETCMWSKPEGAIQFGSNVTKLNLKLSILFRKRI